MPGETSTSTKHSFGASLPCILALGFTTEHRAMFLSKQLGPVGVSSHLFMWLSHHTQIWAETLSPDGLYI